MDGKHVSRPSRKKGVEKVLIDVFDTKSKKFITVEEAHFENVLSANSRYIKKDKLVEVVKNTTTPVKKKVAKKKTAKK